MKKYRIKKIVLILLCLLMIIPPSVTPVHANSQTSIKESDDYARYTTVELIETILDNNYGIYIFLSHDSDTIYDYLLSSYGEFIELETRIDAYEILVQYENELTKKGDSLIDLAMVRLLIAKLSSNTEQINEDIHTRSLRSNNEQYSYSNPAPQLYVKYSNPGRINYNWVESTYTLNNNLIALYESDYEFTDAQKSELENGLMGALGGLQMVGRASARYNCHSYAWYNRTSSNNRHIEYIDYYLTDPHYEVIPSVFAQVGDIVVYYKASGEYTHSAIIVNVQIPSNLIPVITCESKMGQNGIFRHDSYYVPGNYYAGLSSPQYEIRRYTTSHDYEYAQYNAASHARTCEHCGTDYVSHNKTVTTKTSLNHTLKCNDCGWTRTEAHIYPSGSQKCKTCGYNNNGHSTASVETNHDFKD